MFLFFFFSFLGLRFFIDTMRRLDPREPLGTTVALTQDSMRRKEVDLKELPQSQMSERCKELNPAEAQAEFKVLGSPSPNPQGSLELVTWFPSPLIGLGAAPHCLCPHLSHS